MTGVPEYLADLVGAGVTSCAVALTGTAGEVFEEAAAGEARPGRPAGPGTRFDYASLTKPFVATLALLLDREGALSLQSRVGDLWPSTDPRLGRRRLEELLRHRSGLQAWTPLYHRCRSIEEVRELILGGSLLAERPVGAGTYSDLGYILWGLAAEERTGRPLAELLREKVIGPLGLESIEPSPGSGSAGEPDVAISLLGTGKEARLAAAQGFEIPALPPPPPGVPQDGNARFLVGLGFGGGVTGHAGLFGTARDLWRLAREWLAPGRLLHPVETAAALAGGGSFALGWWRRTLRGAAGPALGRAAFGHTGFAGGDLWIDPEAGRVHALLGHRIDPSIDINRWRRRFHRVAARPTPART